MSTQCTPVQLEFAGVGRRRLLARFDGGTLTLNGGALLLRAVEACTGVCRRAAQAFCDTRDLRRVEHTVKELVRQRVMRWRWATWSARAIDIVIARLPDRISETLRGSR